MPHSSKKPAVGSRAQVFHGNAHHTTGGLVKADLMKNRKTGRIISRKKHSIGKRKYNSKKNSKIRSILQAHQFK